MTPAQIIMAAEIGNTIQAVTIPALRSFWGHDLRWWRDLANVVMVWSLIVGAIGAAGVVVSTKLALDWSSEIEKYDGAVTDLKVAAANEAAGGANQKAAQANERAANLENEAAQARLETERLRRDFANRRLTKEQHDKIVSILSKEPATFDVEFMQDSESVLYANDVLKTLTDAGWHVGQKTTPLGVFWTGLVLCETNDPAAVRLAKALVVAHVPFSIGTQRTERLLVVFGGKPAVF